MYDVTNPDDLEDNLNHWFCEIQMKCVEGTPVLFVGSKCDHPADAHPTAGIAEAFADFHSLPHYLVSSKTGEGVNELATLMLRRGFDFKQRAPDHLSKGVVTLPSVKKLKRKSEPKKGLCC
eukprot:gene19840-6976_t